jgi:hypothetical protein
MPGKHPTHRLDLHNNNESVPSFVAYVSDSYCDASEDLEELIAAMQQDAKDAGEDVSIWRDFHYLAAVVLADGTVQRFPQPAKLIEKSDLEFRLKNGILKRRIKR